MKNEEHAEPRWAIDPAGLSLIERLASSSAALRENPVYNGDGQGIRLTVQAHEMEEAAIELAALQARCEAAEQALEGMRSLLREFMPQVGPSSRWLDHEEYLQMERPTVGLIRRTYAVLNPTPQGGKPDSEPEEDPCPGCGDGDKVPAKGYWRCPVCDAEWNDDSEEG